MRLSTSTNIFFNRPDGSKAETTESIKKCAKAGYTVMDMNFHDLSVFNTPFRTDNWEYYINQINECAKTNNIEFSQGHSHFYNFCDKNFPNKEFHDELIRRSVEGAKILGVKWLVIHTATDFNSQSIVKDSKLKSMEYLKPRIELAGKYGVGIAIENLWEENIAPKRRYCSTVEELCDFVDSLNYDNVGCCWDVEHADFCGIDQKEALKYIGKRLKATHISDYNSIKNDHILPFSGVINWKNVMEAFKEVEYNGDFAFEIHNYTGNLPDELIDSAIKHSKAVGDYLLSLCL
ncbi:MAG: sugar phosphate isomerase/epimerase [Christensenellaceae bacterium]|nr:sugar phosphate isomerase/epimerase [Christensenellaceae bacterium]